MVSKKNCIFCLKFIEVFNLEILSCDKWASSVCMLILPFSHSKELLVRDAVIQNPFEWTVVSTYL